jgi:hypothetical protein
MVHMIVTIAREENWDYYTEPGALRRVAANLIGNALKYTSKGEVTITLSAAEPELRSPTLDGDPDTWRLVTLSVKDTGRGISQDFMDRHLFVPFTQEDSTTSEGVGLGMSIVKSLVTLLAGEIKVQSKLGEGTEITVTIPMRRCPDDRPEIDRPSIELRNGTLALREEKLAVALLGFPIILKEGFENYLSQWFHCKVLEHVDDEKPDIILVEEGNKEVRGEAELAGKAHGHHCILLSIAVAADALGERMGPTLGFRKWERIPRPLGPNSIRKALLSCVTKLKELRNEETSGDSGQQTSVERWRDDASNVKDQLIGSMQAKLRNAGSTTSSLLEHASTQITQQASFATRPKKPPVKPERSLSNEQASDLKILVAEDNPVNRKLIAAFLKKYGSRDVQFAENGALAVEHYERDPEGYDVIFMGTYLAVGASQFTVPSALYKLIVEALTRCSITDLDRSFNASDGRLHCNKQDPSPRGRTTLLQIGLQLQKSHPYRCTDGSGQTARRGRCVQCGCGYIHHEAGKI